MTLAVSQVQDNSAATWHYNPYVLVRTGDRVTLEPLSGHVLWPVPKYPGRIQWMPPSAKPTAENHVETDEAQLCFLQLLV